MRIHGEIAEPFSREQPSRELTVKRVCKPCNEGWMSRLEEDSTPILDPMIAGKSVTLSLVNQLQVATWATKTAMTFEGLDPETHVTTTKEERHLLRDDLHRRPPANTRVWLSAYSGSAPLQYFRVWAWRENHVQDERPIAYCATFQLGALLIRVLGSPTSNYWSVQNQGTPNAIYVPCFPMGSGPVDWPPPRPLDDEGLRAFVASGLIIRKPLRGSQSG